MRRKDDFRGTDLTFSRTAYFARVLETLALICVLLAALVLSVSSLFVSAKIGDEAYTELYVSLIREKVWLSLLLLAAGVALLVLLGRVRVTKRFNRRFATIAFTLLGVFGALWVMSVNAHAESDGDIMIQIAEKVLHGDFSTLQTAGEFDRYYFIRSPYQFGIMAYLQAFVALFGATGSLGMLRLANVALLITSYIGLVLMTERLFQDEQVTFLTIALLCLCVQPVLDTTFIYGLIPSFAFSVWAVFFTVCYLQTEKKRFMLPAAALLAAAITVRTTSWIVALAIGVALLLRALSRKRLAPFFIFLALLAAAAPWTKIVQKAYESAADTSFGQGYPKTFWIAMCLQDGPKAAGWHVQWYQDQVRDACGEDMTAVSERSAADIRTKLDEFAANPTLAGEYCFEKLTSMWLEPTFTCIWITKGAPAYAEPEALAKFVYTNPFDNVFRFAMKTVLLSVFAGFAISAIFLMKRRGEERLILPLIVLGGILFHLIIESKSQYVLEYLPLLLPLAAFGIVSLGRRIPKTRGPAAKKSAEEAE